ncbi:hypothetical protein PYV50_15105 [Pseudomonas sp. H22_DOA]|nr:hypothetical protein PYV50_15105 [Pseudomonas sp. H22_DOA]
MTIIDDMVLDPDTRKHLITTITFDQSHFTDSSGSFKRDLMFDGKVQIAIQRALDRGADLTLSPMHLIQVDQISVGCETQIVIGRTQVIDRDKLKPGGRDIQMHASRTR